MKVEQKKGAAPPSEGGLSTRFRNANTALFTLAFIFMIIAMLWAFDGLLAQFSADSVRHRAVSTAEALNTHISQEIAGGVPSGAVAEWLSDEHMRCYIIRNRGLVYPQSFRSGLISDPALPDAVYPHLIALEGFEKISGPGARVVKLPDGPYRFMGIAPIGDTDWSSVIISDFRPYLSLPMLLPVFVTVFLILTAFALGTNAIGRRLIFSPLERLIGSLARMKGTNDEPLYGVERKDELGQLSNTIQDLLTKANYDALTGIYNRRFLESNLPNLMGLLSRSNGFLSVFMVDVDSFKLYNDTYGHDQGDACLKAVAQALAGSVTRTSDFVARYGGEEFVIVLPNTDETGACLIAEELLEKINGLNIPHTKSTASKRVTVSIGVMTGRVERTHKWDEYLKYADEALYESKRNGRNRYTHNTVKRYGVLA